MNSNEYDVLYDGKFLKTFMLKNGDQRWEMTTRKPFPYYDNKPDAVVIVALHTDENKLVVISEHRMPINDFEIGFPAGLIDGNETPEEAATRELFQETGLNTTKILKKSKRIFSSSGLTDESVVMVYLECNGTLSTKYLEKGENIKPMLLNQNEVMNLLESDTISIGAKAWFGMEQYANTGKITY